MDTQLKEPGKLQIFDLLSSATPINRITSRHAEVVMFHVRGPKGSSIVAVKHVLVNGVHTKKSIQNEFQILGELESALGEGLSRSIPRPLLLFENEGTIVFTFVPGVPFDRLLRRYANVVTAPFNIVGARSLERHAHRIGHWLRAFHNATAVTDQPFDDSGFAEEIGGLIPKCSLQGLQASALDKIRDEVVRQSATASNTPIPAAVTHGDFLPQNILLDDGEPSVIDFASSTRSAPIYLDLAHFVGYLLILSRKPLYHEKTIRSVIVKFCKGYQRKIDLSVFRLYVLRAILRITVDSNNTQTTESAEMTVELLSSVLRDAVPGLTSR